MVEAEDATPTLAEEGVDGVDGDIMLPGNALCRPAEGLLSRAGVDDVLAES